MEKVDQSFMAPQHRQTSNAHADWHTLACRSGIQSRGSVNSVCPAIPWPSRVWLGEVKVCCTQAREIAPSMSGMLRYALQTCSAQEVIILCQQLFYAQVLLVMYSRSPQQHIGKAGLWVGRAGRDLLPGSMCWVWMKDNMPFCQ